MKTLKMTKFTVTTIIAAAVLLSPALSSLRAEELPLGFAGPGYKQYLDGKIQNGYYVDRFVQLTHRQDERVNKRRQIEEVLNFAYQASPQSSYAILSDKANLKYQADKLNYDIQSGIQKGKDFATTNGEFAYLKNSDGKTTYFTDGLPSTIKDERVLDEFGNISLRDTFDMKYNDDRLLTKYDATVKDNLGNVSRMKWTGQYTPDSVFYGGDDTNANKHFSEYSTVEYDPAGNQRTSQWKAGGYDGKLLRAFSEFIDDKIYGSAFYYRSNIAYKDNDPKEMLSYHEEGYGTNHLNYSTDRTETTFNDKHQVTGYHEETWKTLIDGTKSKSTLDAIMTYKFIEQQYKDLEPDNDRLTGTVIMSLIENPDGSKRTEKTVNDYNYDINNTITGASGYSEFSGQEGQWFEYKAKNGRIVTKGTDEQGKTTYSYVDYQTQQTTFVPEEEVTTALKNGNYYSGSSKLDYEILYGKPMNSNVDSRVYYTNSDDGYLFKIEDSNISYKNGLVNNMQRQLSTYEYSEVRHPYLDADNTHVETMGVTTTNIHDNLGNLIDAEGKGYRKGWDFQTERGDWVFPYTSEITVEYVVIQGKALREAFHEYKSGITHTDTDQ